MLEEAFMNYGYIMRINFLDCEKYRKLIKNRKNYLVIP